MRIAICESIPLDLVHMLHIVERFKAKVLGRLTVEHMFFSTPTELLASLEKGHVFDLIIFGSKSTGINSMEAAKEIRKTNQITKFIFVADSPKYAVESYTVDTFYYTLKPISETLLLTLLENVTHEIRKHNSDSIIVRGKGFTRRLLLHSLTCVEVINHSLFYYMINNEVLKIPGSLSMIEETFLGKPMFIKPHRSYIVNLDFITVITKKEIKVANEKIVPIAKGKYMEVDHSYLAYHLGNSKFKSI